MEECSEYFSRRRLSTLEVYFYGYIKYIKGTMSLPGICYSEISIPTSTLLLYYLFSQSVKILQA